MPELPEVRTVAKVLKKRILGCKFTNYIIRYNNIIESDSLSFDLLIGKSIEDITTMGKYLIFNLGDMYLVSHLRMEGKFFIKSLDDVYEKHEHIIFTLDNKISLRYHDTRKFGRMILVSNLSDCKGLSKLGLEPFDNKMNSLYLKERFNKSNLTIKELLLDQSIISGLGNIYANEVLFASKINPYKLGKQITKEDCEAIISTSIKILNEAILLGGTTIRSYTSSLGVTGSYQDKLKVHKRDNQKCKICDKNIIKERIGGRSVYYCPNCQK